MRLSDQSDCGTPEEARRSGAIFYTLPTELVPDQIDPLLRDIVMEINASGWCWTAESCQGHPDATTLGAWNFNTEPYLRLVCHQDQEGRLLVALMRSLNPRTEDEQVEAIERGYPALQAARIYRESRGDYAEFMVYLPARTTMERNGGIESFRRFASSVNRATA